MKLWKEKLIMTTGFIAIAAWGYFYANDLNQQMEMQGKPFLNFITQWDHWIPFVPEFIYPYYIYFPFMLLVLPITRTRQQFYQVLTAFAILETTAIATFILLPAKITIRPTVEPINFTYWLVYHMFKIDPGYNLLPSLHVGHSVLVSVFFYVYYPRYFYPVFAVAISIVLATVFIKQHYVIDIPFGILYALVAYNLSKYLHKRWFMIEERSW